MIYQSVYRYKLQNFVHVPLDRNNVYLIKFSNSSKFEDLLKRKKLSLFSVHFFQVSRSFKTVSICYIIFRFYIEFITSFLFFYLNQKFNGKKSLNKKKRDRILSLQSYFLGMLLCETYKFELFASDLYSKV
ncbi:hypothetical protein BpHYR1_018578 [Brachionus plicatilis]|uniref:Uncharacterized protein n=1 Tax=Brachionus plicatilis TaxID=10195 RepID=A0A3M7QJ13_BRAPC|nr:hypothetical protein BpHYR1_018578 [Brachionus plicatilis]